VNPDLEALVAADEEARARVEAARAALQARVQEAENERIRRRQERYETFRKAAEAEEHRIKEEADRAVSDRQLARTRYLGARRRAAEGALANAADVYARIIREGAAPRATK
jgi:hypothetical protein